MTNHILWWRERKQGEKKGEGEMRSERDRGKRLARKERFWGAEAQSCRLSQSVWFKNSSTFPEGEYSGHSWSSIMSDIHSHCQGWQNEQHSGWFPWQSNLQKSTGNCHLSLFVSGAPQIVHQLQHASHRNLYCTYYRHTFLLSWTSKFPQLFLKDITSKLRLLS